MLKSEDLSVLMDTLPSLREMSPALRERLKNSGQPVQLDEGAVVFNDGDRCAGFVAVTDGVARVTKMAEDGRELLLYHVKPGDLCVLTISCILGGEPYPAQGRAGTPLQAIAFDGSLFESLVLEVPEFRKKVFGVLQGRMVGLMSLVEEVAFHRLDRRLARYLLEASENAGSRTIQITHQVIANDLGTSREIVSRILESFSGLDYLRLARGRITLGERSGLEAIAAG